MKFDFSILGRAGLTQAQFADLVGVSRITVNTWVRKRFNPHPTLRPRVHAALKELRAQVRAGELPITTNVRDAMIADHLANISRSLPTA